jgi:hypothetical protein
MVRKNEVNKRVTGAINNWEAEMEADAVVAAESESLSGGGAFIGLGQNQMTFNGAAVPNNEIHCIILDAIFENVNYEGEYDKDNPTGPRCFAYGRYHKDGKTILGIDTWDGDTSEMKPNKAVLNRVCDTCAECPRNQFGSAEKGAGKACKNTRRLALIPVLGATKKGRFTINTTDTEHYATAAMAYIKTPVTSTKIYSGFVQQVAGSLKRPPYGVFTRMFMTPSENMIALNFEAVDSIPSNLGKTIMERHAEAQVSITFPYSQMLPDEKSKRGAKGKPVKGKPAKQEAPAPRGKTKPAAPAPAKPARGGKARF